MPVTYYVALPFARNEEGELVPGEGQDRQSASSAESLARPMAETAAGAVAFSRTGEPATGDFADAVVIRTFGEVPSMENLISAGYVQDCEPPLARSYGRLRWARSRRRCGRGRMTPERRVRGGAMP